MHKSESGPAAAGQVAGEAAIDLPDGAAAGENARVDDEQVEELRRWAIFLSADERREVRAAAKAILLLADDLVAARSQLQQERLILLAERVFSSSARGRGSG